MSTGPVARPARQESLRHHNLGLVLRHVVDAPRPVSRADVAAATGLTRATVSALVDRLVEARLVAELPPVAPQRAGRPAVPLVPAPGAVVGVGLEVNVDYLGVRVLDLSGAVLAEQVRHDDFRRSDPADVLGTLADLARAVVGPVRAAGAVVAGSALALPGLVDRITGPLRVAPNLGWRDVDVLDVLAAHSARSAHSAHLTHGAAADDALVPWLGNEANLAARAEARARRETGPQSFVYVSGEVGIGAAIVLDGAIFPGRHGWSGEIGHTVVDLAGGATLESLAGQDAILDRAGLARESPVRDLCDAADAGEPRALEALAVAGRALGVALANVVNIVDVEEVVLGGTHAVLAAHLRGPLEAALARHVIAAPWAPVEVVVAQAGAYPALTGAALAVLQAVVDDPVASGVVGG